MRKANWDDFRFVLGVAEGGSVGAAARTLGVNHATVLRRIAAFEASHGIEIFGRTATGYAVRPEQLAVIDALRDAARAIDGVAQTIDGARGREAARVRVTSTDSLCVGVLPRLLPGLRAQMPQIAFELSAANAWLDLGRLDADVTVRPAETLPAELDGTPAGRLGFAVYRRRGGPAGPWLAPRGVLCRSRPGQRMAAALDGAAAPACGADSFVTLRELVADGQGRTYLPAILGDPDPRLERDDGLPPLDVPLWVAVHRELGHSGRLAEVRERLAAALVAEAPALSGGISG